MISTNKPNLYQIKKKFDFVAGAAHSIKFQ